MRKATPESDIYFLKFYCNYKKSNKSAYFKDLQNDKCFLSSENRAR
ncbi:hypothetical protein C8C84_1397 [Flavobacterium sp. 102]|nr:hypothetical protein C8C84_1397 [Flavobacterium sp. 102]